MPYVFVDDGFPEAADFEDNYVFVGRREAEPARVVQSFWVPFLRVGETETTRTV